MSTTWILVSNASTGKLLRNAGPNKGIELVREFFHPQSREKNGDLVSDRPGRNPGAGNGHGSFVPATLPKEHEADVLAIELARELEAQFYRTLRGEIEARVAAKKGPITPDGELATEKYRLVVEGPPNWTSFRDFWKMFYDEGAVVVASTYAKVGGVYDFGFRHNPDKPLESLAEYCLGCYTNLNFPQRIDMICKYIEEYQADGLLINSIKSCNSFSAGQLLILREVEKRTGKPAAFVETDLVDPRYFSAANVKNRLESYLQMIDQKRTRGAAH
jgi:benzoyl-CoA reductase/2-hydroxyglutaryl-CoA dehydratase subunit BcrC/BadD/HgdB